MVNIVLVYDIDRINDISIKILGINILIVVYINDTVGDPDRAQSFPFELFELVLLLKFGKQLPVQRFEAKGFSVDSALPSALPTPSQTELGGVPWGDFSCGRAGLSHEDPLLAIAKSLYVVVCMNVCVCSCMLYIYIYTYVVVCMNVCIYIYRYTYTYMYTHVCIYIYIYI